jgi:hypothetical protein
VVESDEREAQQSVVACSDLLQIANRFKGRTEDGAKQQ